MATIRLWTDEEVAADARVKAVFDDIRSTRKSEFVNNFWRALANREFPMTQLAHATDRAIVFCRAADSPELL